MVVSSPILKDRLDFQSHLEVLLLLLRLDPAVKEDEEKRDEEDELDGDPTDNVEDEADAAAEEEDEDETDAPYQSMIDSGGGSKY